MINKIDELENVSIETLNLIKALDNALELAYRDNDDFSHLQTLSRIVVHKFEYVFELLRDVSCKLYALHSEKKTRH